MKWLRLIITILEYVIPALAKRGKDKLAQELEVAQHAIKVLAKDIPPEYKGRVIEEALANLTAVKDFKERVAKKLDKAKDRLYKKLF